MQWFSVKRASPCLVCEKPDWCARSADGSWMLCRRVDAGGRHRTDRAGADYWLYSTDPSVATEVAVVPPGPRDVPESRADDATLDKVYRTLLGAAGLSDEHRDQLIQRGLSNEAIGDKLYRSVSQSTRKTVVRQLRKDFSDEVLLTVPGFYMRRERLALGGDHGLWMPVANVSGSVVAIKVRRDEAEDGARYRYLSSKQHDGPGPGAQVHVPLGYGGETRRVRLTEGELKADVATALTGVLTLGKPGVSSGGALPVLHSLGVETVVMADDADGWTNGHVAGAIKRSVEGLREAGYAVEMETWGLEAAKGIDDLLVGGGTPELAQGDDVDEVVYEMVEAAKQASPSPQEAELRQAVAHGYVIAEAADTDPGAPFLPKALGVLALVKRRSSPDWQRIKALLTGPRSKVSRKDLNDALDRQRTGVGVQVFQETDGGAEPSRNGHEPDLSGVFWEPSDNGVTPQGDTFVPSKHRASAVHMIQQLGGHGFFVAAEGHHYYFDQDQRKLCDLDGFEMAVLLNERYELNEAETFYNFLVKQLMVEAAVRGRHSIVSQFAYYDVEANVVLLDMYNGSVLKLDGRNIAERDNGADGVLFAPIEDVDSWEYIASPGATVAETIIESMNFVTDESCPYEPDEQKLLLLLWMMALAFETVQPTKPLALAVGPAHSGKSNLFRRIGQMLFGHAFQVGDVKRDKEDDYWTKVTSSPFAAFDNVEGNYPWLPDALAKTSTGVKVTKRKLYTNNATVSYTPRCWIALTAHTPTFRREDVASRLLIFHLDRLATMRTEFEVLQEVLTLRNELMSDYARMLNTVLAVPAAEAAVYTMRLADFAGVAERIGRGLDASETTTTVLAKVRQSQFTFATEENPLYLALDLWLTEGVPPDEGRMELAPQTNENRRVTTRQLFRELKEIADQNRLPFRIKNERSLGHAIKNMWEELEMHFKITKGKDSRTGHWYTFAKKPDGTEQTPSGDEL